MANKYWLPDQNNNSKLEFEAPNNSVILIGANGSGKSRLGAWMERQEAIKTHRIGAQRYLALDGEIALRSFEQAEKYLIYGNNGIDQDKWGRWNGRLTTGLLNDYGNVLSALLAKKNKQYDEFIAWCKEQNQQQHAHYEYPETVVDKLISIWNLIFPQRQIRVEDCKVIASCLQEVGGIAPVSFDYQASEMSDGERVTLYLISQCLSVPENMTIIIDEPENH